MTLTKTPLGWTIIFFVILLIGSIPANIVRDQSKPWYANSRCEICGQWMNFAANFHRNFDGYYANLAVHFFVVVLTFVFIWGLLIVVAGFNEENK